MIKLYHLWLALLMPLFIISRYCSLEFNSVHTQLAWVGWKHIHKHDTIRYITSYIYICCHLFKQMNTGFQWTWRNELQLPWNFQIWKKCQRSSLCSFTKLTYSRSIERKKNFFPVSLLVHFSKPCRILETPYIIYKFSRNFTTFKYTL